MDNNNTFYIIIARYTALRSGRDVDISQIFVFFPNLTIAILPKLYEPVFVETSVFKISKRVFEYSVLCDLGDGVEYLLALLFLCTLSIVFYIINAVRFWRQHWFHSRVKTHLVDPLELPTLSRWTICKDLYVSEASCHLALRWKSIRLTL